MFHLPDLISRDQPQPGSFFQRPREAEKRDPGNEVDTKKIYLASSTIYTKWSNPIGCCALAKNCDWFRQITPLSTNSTRLSLLVEWKLTAKQDLNCKIYNSSRKCWKSRVSFCHQINSMSRKAWMLPWILQELKNTLGKLAIAVNLEAIRFEFWTERSVSDGGNLCSLWSMIRKSVWNGIGDTF